LLDEATAEDLRRHWDEGWNAGDLGTIMAPFAPGVVFSYAGTDTLVLVYSCLAPDGTVRRGADSMRVGADGKVVEWRCHYSRDSGPGPEETSP
jgi:hypothetical protein